MSQNLDATLDAAAGYFCDVASKGLVIRSALSSRPREVEVQIITAIQQSPCWWFRFVGCHISCNSMGYQSRMLWNQSTPVNKRIESTKELLYRWSLYSPWMEAVPEAAMSSIYDGGEIKADTISLAHPQLLVMYGVVRSVLDLSANYDHGGLEQWPMPVECIDSHWLRCVMDYFDDFTARVCDEHS